MLDDEFAAAASAAPALRQVTAFTRWVGDGRKLTQTGQLTMADARHLVSLLQTGDEIDPVIGERVFRTRSSAELPVLAIVVAWAKAAGLVRQVRGRLVPVKKNQRLIDRPAQLWSTMFAAFDELGPALCPSGWFQSLLGENFPDGVAILFGGIADGGGAAPIEAVQEEVWSALSARYYLNEATREQLTRLRDSTGHDVRRVVAGLVTLGALVEEDAAAGVLRLTTLAEWALRSRYSTFAPGDQIAQLKITLLDIDPPVWRRVLVPVTIRLDRLDRVIQAAMGWTNSHLHMFIHPSGRYGVPDLDFPLHDERKATLRGLNTGPPCSGGILCPEGAAVGVRWHADGAVEVAAQCGGGAHAGGGGDGVDAVVGGLQQFLRVADPLGQQPLQRGGAGHRPEVAAQVA
jgi:hypothetical protein